jgi:hypothetical protein
LRRRSRRMTTPEYGRRRILNRSQVLRMYEFIVVQL